MSRGSYKAPTLIALFLLVQSLVLAAATRVRPVPVDAVDILSLIGDQRGQVVLLNSWATWCPPSIHEFPEIVAVEKDYRSRGVAVISVSADYPDRMDSQLLPFLEKHRPRFPVYIMRTDDADRFVRTIDPEWSGTIPATLFIDRKGKFSVKRYSRMNRGEMERILEALLEESTK